jgi:hypothetical protein
VARKTGGNTHCSACEAGQKAAFAQNSCAKASASAGDFKRCDLTAHVQGASFPLTPNAQTPQVCTDAPDFVCAAKASESAADVAACRAQGEEGCRARILRRETGG